MNIYSFWGLALIIALNSFPFIFIFTKSALDLISSEMEDAANILGAGAWTTMRRVTLPLAWPSSLAGLIIVFLETIALFGAPALIGIPARFNVVTTQLWQFFEFPVRAEVAAAYAMPLLLVTIALMWLQKVMLSRKGFVSQTGKGGERRMVKLGPWKWPVFGYCAFVGLLSVALPMIVLLQASFSRAWGRGFSLDNFTLQNYANLILHNEIAYTRHQEYLRVRAGSCDVAVHHCRCDRVDREPEARALWRRPVVSLHGAVRHSGHRDGHRLLCGICVTAACAVRNRTSPRTRVYTRFLPIAYANGSAALRSLHPEMEEAVRILGGTRLTAIRRVVAPLLKRSLAGGWLLIFILATRELSAAIFLVGPQSRTISGPSL